MKIDLHVHTKYSRDSLNSLPVIRKVCRKKNMELAITDHNEIKGALKFNPKIIGEEIKTREGEIIGLFLNEKIDSGLSAEETMDAIKSQGALAMVPHPFDRLRKSRLKAKFGRKIGKYAIDILEVCNSRTIIKQDNIKAGVFAESHGILKAVGSDAHFPFEIGSAYVEMEDFHSPKEFLKNLGKARLRCRRSPIYVHALTKLVKLIRPHA